MTTLTSLTSNSGTAATSFTTASVTLAANCLGLLSVVSREQFNFVATAIPTVTGWTQVTTFEYDTGGSSRERITLFRRLSGSSATGTHTIDFGATSQQVARWSIVETDATVDTGGTNGADAVVQVVTNSATALAANTPLVITLAAFGSTGNATFGCFGFEGDGGSNVIVLSVGSGFTSLANLSGGGILDAGLLVEYRTDNDTSVDATNAILSNLAGGIAIEIKAAASGDPTATDAITLAGTASATGTFSAAATDAANVDDAAQAQAVLAESVSQSIDVNDAAAAASSVSDAAEQAVDLGDAATDQATSLRPAEQAVDLGDSATALAAGDMVGEATVDLNDSASSTGTHGAAAAAAVDLSDQADSQAVMASAAADAVDMGDSATSALVGGNVYDVDAADGITLGDSANRTASSSGDIDALTEQIEILTETVNRMAQDVATAKAFYVGGPDHNDYERRELLRNYDRGVNIAEQNAMLLKMFKAIVTQESTQ